MNILILGSGGREHALAWKIKQSSHCETLYIAPGNAGTKTLANNVSLDLQDFGAIKRFVHSENIQLVVVGPEAPLVAGIVDYFEADDELNEVAIIGPGSKGAQLEGSKDFSKAFMQKHNIPTAKAKTFTEESLEEGLKYLENKQGPYVLKADGLAAGKGVIISDNLEEAQSELRKMLSDKKFGEASSKVVIEDFLSGIELSVFVLTDGKNYKILPEAKDYKRIGEGDTGPNTGGMGAVSPVHFADADFMKKVENRVVKPTIEGLAQDNIPYKGFIFIGLMNQSGDPYVIEYNVRMGDPETQVVMPRIEADLVKLLESCWDGKLDETELNFIKQYATTVVMASGGYPGGYDKGFEISGLDTHTEQTIVFHAGTKESGEKVTNSGGRVLAITGLGDDLDHALQNSYTHVGQISWEKANYRKDIGLDLKRYE